MIFNSICKPYRQNVMTTLNVHAQESKSRFSCLSASDPENIPDVRKEVKNQYTTKARKSNKPWPPARRAERGDDFFSKKRHGSVTKGRGVKIFQKLFLCDDLVPLKENLICGFRQKKNVMNPSRGEGFGEKSASRDLWTVPYNISRFQNSKSTRSSPSLSSN